MDHDCLTILSSSVGTSCVLILTSPLLQFVGMWWMMVSLTALMGAVADKPPVPCEEARMKCAYRTGCGMALQNYVVGCSAVLQGPPLTTCPEICQHSLIALTSTEEGKELMRVSNLKKAFCYLFRKLDKC